MEIVKCKPNLFIVGAAKSGTTSLYDYLSQHPDIYMCPIKEPNFFSNVISKNEAAYQPPDPKKSYHMKIINNLQDYLNLFDSKNDYLYRGEASPSYLWDRNAASKIYSFNPDARIIIILREPGARAYSHYKMAYSLGLDKSNSFIAAINKDSLNTNRIWGASHFYLDLSFYSQQIKKYFDIFPIQQIYILKFEDLVKKPIAEIKNICRFLNIQTDKVDTFQLNKRNESKTLKNVFYGKMLFAFKNDFILKKIRLKLGKGFKNNLKRVAYSNKKGKNNASQITNEIRDFLDKTFESEKEILRNEYNIQW